MSAQTIWLDVTTIYAWSTTAVGIVRMEMECVAYAADHLEEKVRFCRFDGHRGFVVLERQEVLALLTRLQQQARPQDLSNPAANALNRPTSNLAVWKARVKRGLHYLPPPIAKPIWYFGAQRKTALLALLNCLRELGGALKQCVYPQSATRRSAGVNKSNNSYWVNRAPFEKGDVYISMGLDWDNKDLPYLFAQKRHIGFQVILFCYDIIPIKFPHLCVGNVAAVFGKYFTDVAWCADAIYCISKQSMRDLTQFLQATFAPVPPMQVVPLGASLSGDLMGTVSAPVMQLASRPYLLFVSTIERRKNHEVLYRAYLRLIESGKTDLPQLVFVGKLGWGIADFLADVKFDPRIQGYITILNHVTDVDLNYLYQNAYFTVYPSLYEGWGLPVAESLMSGKFCLVANDSSLPEVGGSFVEYVDPWDVQAWANQIAYFVDHPQEVHKREAMIRANYQATSWQHASEQIFAHAQSQLIAAKGEKG